MITPDFPPARGGIQLLLQRVVAGWTRLQPVVVTLAQPDAAAFDATQPYRIHRVVDPPGPRAAAIAGLNAYAASLGLLRRADVVLCGHVVTAPSAEAIRRLGGVPYAQYLYAKELDNRPGLARRAIGGADKVIAISAYTAQLARSLGAQDARLSVILPGVDAAPPATVQRAQRPTIVTVSRLRDEYKGHDVMLEAMTPIRQAIPDVQWVVVGDGPLRPALEARAAELGLGDAVRFEGSVSDAERDAWLDRGWVFSMPSRVPPDSMSGEGFGIVFLEGGAHGMPVVAGGVGGALDAVVDGETGLLVDPTDPTAVADALIRLLSDRPLAERMGAAGLARSHEFAWPLVARRVEDEILELVPDAARAAA